MLCVYKYAKQLRFVIMWQFAWPPTDGAVKYSMTIAWELLGSSSNGGQRRQASHGGSHDKLRQLFSNFSALQLPLPSSLLLFQPQWQRMREQGKRRTELTWPVVTVPLWLVLAGCCHLTSLLPMEGNSKGRGW